MHILGCMNAKRVYRYIIDKCIQKSAALDISVSIDVCLSSRTNARNKGLVDGKNRNCIELGTNKEQHSLIIATLKFFALASGNVTFYRYI